MEIAALVALTLISLIGCILVFFTSFGTLVILLGVIGYALLTRLEIISLQTLIVLSVLYLSGEVLEYLCIIIGARKFGASSAAAFGALFGGIAGGILASFIPGIGTVLGVLAGIFLGAFLVEYRARRDLIRSIKAGVGGLIGRFAALFSQFIIALCMITVLVFQITKKIDTIF